MLRKSTSFASALLAFIPGVTAALYVAGWAREQSFMLSLGLSEAEFPLSFERAVLGGFLGLHQKGLPSIWYFAWIIIGAGVVLSVVGTIIQKRRGRRRKRCSNVSTQNPLEQSRDRHFLEDLGDRLFNGAVGILGAILIVTIIVLAAVSDGESTAERFRERASKRQLPRIELHVSNSDAIVATLITCRDAQCAY